MRQELRDRLNRPIGRYDHQGDRIEGRDRLGRLVGWYSAGDDQTRDRLGRIVGRGNMLSALIVP
jgi:hypothetical protein